MATKVLFLHGLESAPNGSKYVALTAAGYEVIAPDLQGLGLVERVAVAVEMIRLHRCIVVGSSFGGLTAVLATMQAGVEIPGIVLAAPALGFEDPGYEGLASLHPVAHTVIVHGDADDICPLKYSQDYVANHEHVELVVVQDGHRLNDSVPEILAAVRKVAG